MGRAPRTPGMARARRMYARHAEAARLGIPVEELPEFEARSREPGGRTRRELLAGGAALAGGVALATSPALSLAKALRGPSTNPRIAIVGAGLAGLRCAHELWMSNPANPVGATVYDANPERPGGRCWTLRGFFADGLESEHGGSFINSNQHSIRRLAAGLGLEEELVNGGDLLSGEEVYWIEGSRYTYEEANEDWGQFGYRAFHRAIRELATPMGEQRLDSMSVPEWLDSTPIGSGSRFGRLMLANVVTENGGDPEDMSALDLIEVTGNNRRASLSPIPGDDERFHIVGGNDQVVSRMIAQLPGGVVKSGHQLVALRANADGSSSLVFDVSGGVIREVRADVVVLALPFSTLRLVDLSRSGLSPAKLNVIETFGMGSNAKIHVELTHKTWPALGYSGATYGEWDAFCCAWDDSVASGSAAEPALFLGFPGGHVGRSTLTGEAHGPAPAIDVQWLLSQIELLYPGTQAAYTGRAYEDHWALDPWVRGAYSYCRVGQASSYGALAARSEGQVHFVGEHTSVSNQGFLDGAVQTGERAAGEILRRLGRGSARSRAQLQPSG